YTQADQEVFNSSARVFTDTEQTWSIIFEDQLGGTYNPPNLVVFEDYVSTGCGQATSQTGPFYCSADQRVYIDLDFFKELERQFKAPGDFAQAYVISHEVGHHVQNLLGTLQYVNRQQARLNEADANALSVALELQADCYAGVWAYQAQYGDLILERGDLEEALNAASAIGDDRIQMQSMGYVVPDTFTHGTSAERVEAFRKGMDAGMVTDCNCPELPNVG
ncbi:MAG TPA: neutral zinc metallopeptidase, partial [Methanoregulaceae archaeon]|nr:neutral zinc metallopeptidase [Methanoregulaceae archaeon]